MLWPTRKASWSLILVGSAEPMKSLSATPFVVDVVTWYLLKACGSEVEGQNQCWPKPIPVFLVSRSTFGPRQASHLRLAKRMSFS